MPNKQKSSSSFLERPKPKDSTAAVLDRPKIWKRFFKLFDVHIEKCLQCQKAPFVGNLGLCSFGLNCFRNIVNHPNDNIPFPESGSASVVED